MSIFYLLLRTRLYAILWTQKKLKRKTSCTDIEKAGHPPGQGGWPAFYARSVSLFFTVLLSAIEKRLAALAVCFHNLCHDPAFFLNAKGSTIIFGTP